MRIDTPTPPPHTHKRSDGQKPVGDLSVPPSSLIRRLFVHLSLPSDRHRHPSSGCGDCIGSNSRARGSRRQGRGRGRSTDPVHHVDKQIGRRAIRACLLLLLLGTHRTGCRCECLCPSYCSSCGSWHGGNGENAHGGGVGGMQ